MDEGETNRLLGEWRQNVMESLKSIHGKLDGFDGRLRIVEIGIIQKVQIEKLEARIDTQEKRLNSLEGFKQRILGYAGAIGLVAGAAFELVRSLWRK